jgi:hypothetical protein
LIVHFCHSVHRGGNDAERPSIHVSPIRSGIPAACEAGASYRNRFPRSFEAQARSLAALTGWDMAMIRQHMRDTGQQF